MCPCKPRQNTCSVHRSVCPIYIHCEVLQVVRRSAVFRVPAAWWYVAGWPAQLSPNRQPHKAFLQDHLCQSLSFKRDFNKYMAGSKAFLLEHLSYKLMITIPRHHTRHKMLHISIFIWVFGIRVVFVVVFVATFEVETISWSLGHSVENLDVETGDPWSEKPPMIPVRHRGNQSFAVYCICICICIVFVFVYVLFFVSLWWSTEPDTFLLSAFSAFNTSLIWIERESPDASYLHLMSDKPFELIINARKHKMKYWGILLRLCSQYLHRRSKLLI